ncbi:MAG: DoxX family protein, partial [Thermoanaerobaculia bacterium]
MIAASPPRSIAFARIVTGVILFCEGFGKVTGAFVHAGFAKSAGEMAAKGYPFWRPFLERVVLVHPAPFAWAIALGEIAISLSLVSGLLVRVACAGGIAMMLAVGFGTSWPGGEAHWYQFVTSWLTQGAYALLFFI